MSHPGRSSNTPSHFMLNGNWDKLWLDRPFSSSAEFILMLLPSFLGMPHSMIHVFYLLTNLMLCVQREETIAMNKRTGLLLSF